MSSEPRRPPATALARRTVLFGAAAAGMVAIAGCNPLTTATRITQTVTAAPPPAADPILTLVATTRLHLVRLTNAIAADKTLAARLTPLRDDRQSHLTALIAELGRTSPAAAAQAKAAPTTDPSIQVPTGGPAQLLAGLRADAALAQGLFTDSFEQASRYRAALFGSVAAALASHRVALA